MKTLFCLLFLVLNISAISQNSIISKPALDTSILNKWPTVSSGSVSNNGKYVSYAITQYNPNIQVTTILRASDDKWKRELPGVTNVKFTDDSKSVIFSKSDTLCILQLGRLTYTTITHVQSFRLISNKRGNLLIYQLNSIGGELVVLDMSSGRESRYNSVATYEISKSGQAIVLQKKNEDTCILEWIDLEKQKSTVIWSRRDAKVEQFLFDANAVQLVFKVANKDHQSSIGYYLKGNVCASEILSDTNFSTSKQLKIGSLLRFSTEGLRLFLTLETIVANCLQNSKLANVNVWSYRDSKLQSEQLNEIRSKKVNSKSYFSVLNLKNRTVLQVQQENEQIKESGTLDDFCIMRHLDAAEEVSDAEIAWNPAYKQSILYLISLHDGSRKVLPWRHETNIHSDFSPNGKYIIYWESPTLHLFSYEIATGITRNISSLINADLTVENFMNNPPPESQSMIGMAGWLKNDSAVLIYDRNDIWMVDPLGKFVPKNITNGFGARQGIILRLESKVGVLDVEEKLILVAFNERTKENGYFSTFLGKKMDPTILSMGAFLYSDIPWGSKINDGLTKARDVNTWLVMRQTANQSPNYYLTSNFKIFKQVSNLCPEKSWNWFTTELHNWIAQDNTPLQGILYKPENFDSNKKYPVLLSYYEQFSNELNVYKKPDWSNGRINIPWFVSQGYLVFTPDIYYNLPKLKQSIVNCVVSAANYLSKLPFVDSAHIGIQGHSFGGMETGCLVTSTNIFAAACASSGYYNFVSDANSILPRGTPRAGVSERYMGGTVWDQTKEFIENSPIFSLQKVTTPLLIMTGDLDNQVPHDQSVELFLGLRRLHKVAWMLSYEDSGHTLSSNINNAKDFTIRMTQFFDHYLKGAYPPRWMTRGISAAKKYIETGYGLDKSGICNIDCKVCKKLDQQYTSKPDRE